MRFGEEREKFSLLLRPCLGMKKVNPVRIFPIVFGNKAAAAAAVSFFNTEHTGAG